VNLDDEFFRSVFQSHQAIMLLIDPDSGSIIDANKAAVDFYKYPKESLLNLRIQDMNALPEEEVNHERQKAFAGEKFQFIFPHRLATGKIKWVEVYSSPVRLSERPLLFSIIHDITDRRKVEKALVDSQALYESVIETQQELIVRVDKEGRFVFMNDAYCRIFGLKREEMIGKNKFVPLVYEEDLPATLSGMKLLEKPPHRVKIEQRAYTIAGLRWIEWEDTAIIDNHGKIIEIQGVGRDIHDRKLMEESLKLSEEKFSVAFQSNPNGLIICNFDDGKIIDTNDSFLHLTGFSRQEVIDMEPEELQIFPVTDDWKAMIRKLLREGTVKQYELKIINKALKEKITLVSADILDMGMGKSILCSMQEITERREMEEALRKSEERFREAFEFAPVGIFLKEVDGKFIYVNKSFCTISGYNHQELINSGIRLNDITYPDDKTSHISEYDKLIRGEMPAFFMEKRYRRKNGEIVWVRESASMMFNRNGDPYQIVGLVEDITGQKESAINLKKNEERLQAMFNHAAIGIVETDNEDRFVHVNDRLYEILGYDKDELIGKTVTELTHPDDRSVSIEMNSKLHRDELRMFNYEKRYLKKDGSAIWAQVTVSAIHDLDGKYLYSVATIQDISERKHNEEIIRKEHDLLQSIIDNVPAMITIYDPHFKSIRTNKEVERITGWTDEDQKKKGVMELVYPQLAYRKEITEYMSSLQPGFKDIIMATKEGTRIDTVWANVQLPDGRQVGIGLDISERKKMEMQIRNLAKFPEENPHPVMRADNSGKIMYSNDAGKILLSELKTSIGEYVPELLKQAVISSFAKNEQKRIEISTGGKIFMFVLSPVRESGYINMYGSDITEIRQLQEQIISKNNHLTRVNQLLEDFVHIAAHDLRGPVGNLAGIYELIEEEPKPEAKISHISMFGPIISQLQRTIEGLMETINVQKEKNVSAKISLPDALKVTSADLSIEILKSGCIIESDFTMAREIRYVSSYILSIMKNLISNSIKYARENVTPHIQITSSRTNGFVLLRFSDNGMGIDLDAAGKDLFKPFKRFTKKAEGTGMGLYIVKSIIEKNSGRIEMESMVNGGTKFYCYLKEYSA